MNKLLKLLLHPIISYKNKKKKKKELEKKRLAESKLSAERKLFDATLEMINKPCAINGSKNCFRDCVHFKEGYVEFNPEIKIFGEVYYEAEYVYTSPRCKLWK